jgi:TonB-dependent receptor
MSKAFIRASALLAVSSLALVANSAHAQDGATDGKSGASTQREEDIIVTGTRGSLENAEKFKRDNDVLVDGISADDIGALPDESIADSLVRIPGLTANDDENGFSEVSVRGLGPDLANTTYNGRILPSTRLDSRRLDLGDLPTEGVARAYVQKTSDAGTIEGGLGGTIGLESVHPLETRRRGFTLVGRLTTDDVAQALEGVYGFQPWGYRTEAGYVGKLADNFGVAVSYAHVKQTNAAPSTQLVNPRTRTGLDADGDHVDDIVAGNAGINMGAGTQVRDSVIATVQWRPISSLTATLDGYYISNGGQSSPINFIGMNNDTVATAPTSVTSQNSLVRKYVGYTTLYQETVNISEQKSQQIQGGFNLKWDNGGPLQAAFDISWARAKVSGHNASAIIKTLSNTPKRTPAGQIRPFGYDTTDPHNVVLDFGTQLPTDYMLTEIDENNPYLTDTAKAGRLDFKYDRPIAFIGSMEFGVRADRRVKDNTPDGNAYTFGGALTNPALDASYLVSKPYALSNASQWLGGPSAGTLPIFDLEKLRAFETSSAAVYNNQRLNDVRNDSTVTEDTFAAYYQANIDAGPLKGNIGLRWFKTNATIDGFALANATAVAVAQEVKHSYDFWLPSLNLRYALTHDLFLRASLSKTVSRPIFSAVRIGSGIDFTTVTAGSIVTRGNPDLKPYTSKNADLSLEWYPSKAMSFAVQGFYKQVDNFITNGLVDGELETPGGSTIPVTFSTNVNDPTVRHFYGVEVIARRDFDFLPGMLSNLGVRFDYAHNWTDATQGYQTVNGGKIFLTPNNFTKETVNGQLYYTTRGFDLRFAYRYYSPYMRENSNGYQSRPGGTLDVTTSITLVRGFRLIGSVRNLTKTHIYSTQVDARYPDAYGIPRNVLYSGRQLTVGVRAQF